MSTDAALYRLLAWLSPAYPVGAYSYSHGLEWAVEAGLVRDRAGLEAWLATVLRHGGGWMDAVLAGPRPPLGDRQRRRGLARAARPRPGLDAHRRAGPRDPRPGRGLRRRQPRQLARPRRPPAGPARRRPRPDLSAWRSAPSPPATACRSACCCRPTSRPSPPTSSPPLSAWSHSARPTASAPPPPSSPTVREVAALAPSCPLDELGTATLTVDLCSMRHETQYTRLFRS